MQTFIVVLEYSGAFLLTGTTATRAPVCEHAYDLDDGSLAGHHAGDLPRVGFPVCQRGWNTPEQAARCPDCDMAVQCTVRDLITAVVGAITSHRSPGPGPPAPERTGSSWHRQLPLAGRPSEAALNGRRSPPDELPGLP